MSKSPEERLLEARETAAFWMGCVAVGICLFAATPALIFRFGFSASTSHLPFVAAGGWFVCLLVAAFFGALLRPYGKSPRYVVYIGTCLYFIVVGFIPESWGLALARLVGLI